MTPPVATFTVTVTIPLSDPNDYPEEVTDWEGAAWHEFGTLSISHDADIHWAAGFERLLGGDDFVRTPPDAP